MKLFNITKIIFSVAPGAPPPTPLTGSYQKDQNFFSKLSAIDEKTIKTLESVFECDNEENVTKNQEKPRSNIRTIQSELPQRTFTSNFNKRKKMGDQDDNKWNQSELNKLSPKYSTKMSPKSGNKTTEGTLFPFPPRSSSPKSISRSSSPKLKRDISSSLKKLADISSPFKININDVKEQDGSSKCK